MVDQVAAGQVGLADNTAQSGMGMHPAEAPCDREVELPDTGPQHCDIARLEWRFGINQTEDRRVWQPLGQIQNAHGIAGGYRARRSSPGHRCREQPDTIEPGCRIAAMETKARAHKGFGSFGQRGRGHALGDG